MSLSDILLQIDTYPDPTPPEAIEEAVGFVRLIGGKVSGLAVGVSFPIHSNRIADYLIGLSSMADDEQARSLVNGRASLAAFTAAAEGAGVFGQALLERADYYAVAEHVALRARTRDLCMTPLGKPLDGQTEVATSVVFDSGRPSSCIIRDTCRRPSSAPRSSPGMAAGARRGLWPTRCRSLPGPRRFGCSR